VLKVHVKNGVAIRVETDDGDEPQLRACARGRAYRKEVYSADRLRFPLKRIGARGEGQFERISWGEALDKVAAELTRVKETYGPTAIWGHTYSGQVGRALSDGIITLRNLLEKFGGYTTIWGNASADGGFWASHATYGTLRTAHDRDDLLNSRFILIWGLDPATSVASTNTSFCLAQAKEAGARIVVVDPRYSTTAAVFADEWIPIKPSTDTAMMLAMAHVMITENLHDQEFLDRYTVGFEKFREYLTGMEDGVPKTPTWAEAKTGVPADIIVSLAREYATTKPATIIAGWAPGRTACGEQYHRAASVLQAMTANIGIHGGGAAGCDRGIIGPPHHHELPDGATYEEQLIALDPAPHHAFAPHICHIWDAILKGTAGGYPSDIKMAYIIVSNPLSSFPNINKGVEALKKLEFIVVHERFMTATARFADILLPVVTNWERSDFSRPWHNGQWFIYQNKAIEPLFEARTDWHIFRDLAHRLHIDEPLLDLPEEEAIRAVVQGSADATVVSATAGVVATGYKDVREAIPDFEKFKKEGVHKMERAAPMVAFKKQIEDPKNNPFPTPSGKIEIFCQRIADLKNPDIPPIPKYADPVEGPEDLLRKKFPLQLITIHPKMRAHSCFGNIPWLSELDPQSLWISIKDAKARGIKNGEKVRVFNDRGEAIVPAKVTQRIMPGVVGLSEGAWYRPDKKGRDQGGNPNILTRDECSATGAFPSNTSLVQAEKFTGKGT
jgi:anaerobic dimethyl sulfoxide reductase subunit A